jgi:ribosomal protein S18 acetylase RimI-like enzyme
LLIEPQAMINVSAADLANTAHRDALVSLLDGYARDPMGGGAGLRPEVRQNLPAALQARKDCEVVIAWKDDTPVGLAICFEGFSTFQCRPLLNIHDLVVSAGYRSQGIAKQLLEEVEHIAVARHCCKLTLEVLTGNTAALALYTAAGFVNYELDPELGKAVFLEKKLPPAA